MLRSMPTRTHGREDIRLSALLIKTAFQLKKVDQNGYQFKLMTLEALYIRTLKPAIKTRDEYRTRALTLKA